MKLLLFIPSLGAGGAERVATTLANHWAEMGWQVILVTLARKEEDRFGLHSTVTRVPLNLASDRTSLIGAIVSNARRIRALRRVLAREHPNIAVAMMSTCNVLLALASVGLTHTTYIGSERVHAAEVPLGSAWEWLRSHSYRLLDAVAVLTSEEREWVQAHTAARRAVVIPNPVTWPLAPQQPSRPPDAVGSPGRKRVLAAGRLAPQKCYDKLIEVFGRLSPGFHDWELVIVGEGPERDRLQCKIDGLGLGQVVHLAGYVGNIGDWYQRADLYVLTSRFEGFPNALAEAMSYGLPAVSVDCETGPRDIIRHEVDGLLVPPGKDAALEAALRRLMGDGTRRAQFGSRAVEVRTRFSIERVHEMWVRLFREVTT